MKNKIEIQYFRNNNIFITQVIKNDEETIQKFIDDIHSIFKKPNKEEFKIEKDETKWYKNDLNYV